ncbi:MAG: T9SS type A sorting domain-containing protein, partial [bacterium]
NIIRTGSAASKIYGWFAGCPGPHGYNVGGYGQAFTPIPGMNYQFSGYSFVSSGDDIPGDDTCTKNRCLAKVVFFDAPTGGFELSGNEVVIGDWQTVTDQWNHFSVSAPCPVGAQRVEALILFLQPECDTGSVFIDDTSLFELPTTLTEPNLLVNPSFDGGLTGWSTFSNVYYDGRNWAARTPLGSAKMFSSFDDSSDTGMYQTFPATPGTNYELSVYVLDTCQEDAVRDTNDNFALASIVFTDAVGDTAVGAVDTLIADNTSPLGTWTQYTLIGTAPAGTDSVSPYFLFISPSLLGGAFWFDDASFKELPAAGVSDETRSAEVRLHQNAPNPFGSSTLIRFDLARPAPVRIGVYNVKGELVSTLVDEHMTEGRKEIGWNATDARGKKVAGGVYFYRLVTGDTELTRKMIVLH